MYDVSLMHSPTLNIYPRGNTVYTYIICIVTDYESFSSTGNDTVSSLRELETARLKLALGLVQSYTPLSSRSLMASV